MNANILRDALGNITVQMQGDLEYEHSVPLRNQLRDLAQENPNAKITVDLGGVDFVGSSGICHFVETISLLNKENNKKQLGLSNVSGDFKKITEQFFNKMPRLAHKVKVKKPDGKYLTVEVSGIASFL